MRQHTIRGSLGCKKPYDSISIIPKLLEEVQAQVTRCDICQRMKRGSRQYGLLAPWDAKSAPWSDVATDCIRPWVIELRGGREYSLRALTTIDVTINLLEIEPILTQTATECARALKMVGCRITHDRCASSTTRGPNLWVQPFKI